MSDSDSSDGIEDLKDFLNKYEEERENEDKKVKEEKEKEKASEQMENEDVKVENEDKDNSVPMDKVLFGDKKSLYQRLAEGAGEELLEDLKEKKKSTKRKAVWVDEDDELLTVGEVKKPNQLATGPIKTVNLEKKYKDVLTDRFTKIVAQPKWADLDRKPENSDEEDELLRTVGFLERPPEDVLSSHLIRLKRLKDLNRSTYLEKNITSVNFHPTSTAALVTDYNGFASIYSIDGIKNEKLHSMSFKDFPILSSQIYPNGEKAIFGSLKNVYYRYDLLTAKETRCILPRHSNSSCRRMVVSPCGKYIAIVGRKGDIHLMTSTSNEVIHTFKHETSALDVGFTADSEKLFCNDLSSNVGIFSLKARRLEHYFTDEGCIHGSVIRLSPNQRMLATGSREGVVNVYDFEKVYASKTPKPIKSFMNLRTGISDINFNHSSEILAMCTNQVRNAVRLAHFPSANVYSNFPTVSNDLGKISNVQFSPNSGFLALGTTDKEVPLIRLKHFKNY